MDIEIVLPQVRRKVPFIEQLTRRFYEMYQRNPIHFSHEITFSSKRSSSIDNLVKIQTRMWGSHSSDINEVIRPVLIFFFFFFTIRFDKYKKALKCTKRHQKALKNTTNLRFIKIKNHLSEKNNLFAYLRNSST